MITWSRSRSKGRNRKCSSTRVGSCTGHPSWWSEIGSGAGPSGRHPRAYRRSRAGSTPYDLVRWKSNLMKLYSCSLCGLTAINCKSAKTRGHLGNSHIIRSHPLRNRRWSPLFYEKSPQKCASRDPTAGVCLCWRGPHASIGARNTHYCSMVPSGYLFGMLYSL